MAESLKNKTIKGVTWSFLGSFSNQFLTLVFGIVLARLLAPSDYGLIALTYVFVAISNTFVDSGFSVALVRKEGVKECDYCTALFFNVIVAVPSDTPVTSPLLSTFATLSLSDVYVI